MDVLTSTSPQSDAIHPRFASQQFSTHFEENGARFAPPESPLATFVATEAPGVKALAPVETHTANASTTKTLFMVVMMLLSRSNCSS